MADSMTMITKKQYDLLPDYIIVYTKIQPSESSKLQEIKRSRRQKELRNFCKN